MRIMIVVDTPGWAIDHLAQAKIKYNPQYHFKCVYVHPRDAGETRVQDEFEKTVREFNPDVIHFEYYRVCSQLLEAIPFLKTYKIVLTHHNQRDKALSHKDWCKLGVDMIVTHTEKCKELLKTVYHQPKDKIKVINHGIDLAEFTYSSVEPEEKAIGYAGRIEPWKGLKEIAEVGKEQGYPVMFMGREDDRDYYNSISEEARANINFSFMNCKDEERLQYYRSLTCYIGFSKDGYEEGTLELLEAMACGVPVITTPSGVARDICNNTNSVLIPFEDKQRLSEALQSLMNDPDLRNELRKNAWETVKNMSEEKMAYQYSQVYNQVVYPEQPLVSVIVPTTFDRVGLVEKLLKSIQQQTYPNIETVIAFDEPFDKIEQYLDSYKKLLNRFPRLVLKFVITGLDTYGLAKARNLAVIEAEGDVLVFVDSRFALDESAILFLKQSITQARSISEGGNKKIWVFGDKGSQKSNFVENFSAVGRDYFIKFGMFNEEIDKYGGMSQEIRTRWTAQGGTFVFVPEAKAYQLVKAHKDDKRRQDIIEMKFRLYKLYRGINY